MNRVQLLELKIGDRVKDKHNGAKGTVTGWVKHDECPDEWDLSDIFTDNDAVSTYPHDLIVLRKKQPETVGIEWFSRGGGLACMGPFKNELKAWESVMSAKDPTKPVQDAIVWCARKKIMTDKDMPCVAIWLHETNGVNKLYSTVRHPEAQDRAEERAAKLRAEGKIVTIEPYDGPTMNHCGD